MLTANLFGMRLPVIRNPRCEAQVVIRKRDIDVPVFDGSADAAYARRAEIVEHLGHSWVPEYAQHVRVILD